MALSTYHPLHPRPRPDHLDLWHTVEVHPSRQELLAQAKKLEAAWPGRYEARVVALQADAAFALTLRHRA